MERNLTKCPVFGEKSRFFRPESRITGQGGGQFKGRNWDSGGFPIIGGRSLGFSKGAAGFGSRHVEGEMTRKENRKGFTSAWYTSRISRGVTTLHRMFSK
jgi:hypothetical protein